MACLENHSHRLNPKKWRATENAKTLRPLKDLCTHSTVQSTCVLNSCTRVVTTSTTATNHPNLLRASNMTSVGTSITFHACLLDVNNMLPKQFTKFGSYFASLASCQCHRHVLAYCIALAALFSKSCTYFAIEYRESVLHQAMPYRKLTRILAFPFLDNHYLLI